MFNGSRFISQRICSRFCNTVITVAHLRSRRWLPADGSALRASSVCSLILQSLTESLLWVIRVLWQPLTKGQWTRAKGIQITHNATQKKHRAQFNYMKWTTASTHRFFASNTFRQHRFSVEVGELYLQLCITTQITQRTST